MEHIKTINTSLEFTQLLMTKFCHDITGPIGAINNGVELVQDDPDMKDVAMQLITDSAKNALIRLQYYRFAYGILKQDSAGDVSDVIDMLKSFFNAQKIDVQCHLDDKEYTQYQCRILCNLCLIASHVLIRGGVMVINSVRKNDMLSSLTITVTGQTIKLDELIADALTLQTIEADKKTVQAYYTMMLVQEAGALSHQLTDNSFTLTYQVTS